jgi:hypothetical protein
MIGVGVAVRGVDGAVVDVRGTTDSGASGPVGLSRNTSMTIGTATAADPAAISAIAARLVRYHRRGGGRNVNVLLSEARS